MGSQISPEDESSSDDKTDLTELVNLSDFREQKSTIEKLTLKVKNLEEERDSLQKETELLRQENATLKEMVQSHGFRGKPSSPRSRQSWKLRLTKQSYSCSDNCAMYEQLNDANIQPVPFLNDKVHKRNFTESTPKRSISLDHSSSGHGFEIG